MRIDTDLTRIRDFAATAKAADLVESLPAADDERICDGLEAIATLIEELHAAEVFTVHGLPAATTLDIDPVVITDCDTYTIDLAVTIQWTSPGGHQSTSARSYGHRNYTCTWFDMNTADQSAAHTITYIADAVVAQANDELRHQQRAWTSLLLPVSVFAIAVDHRHGRDVECFTTEEKMREWFITEHINPFDRDEGPDDPEALMSWYLDGSRDISARWEKLDLPLPARP